MIETFLKTNWRTLLFFFVLLWSWLVFPTPFKYYSEKDGDLFRRNRLTGKVECWYGSLNGFYLWNTDNWLAATKIRKEKEAAVKVESSEKKELTQTEATKEKMRDDKGNTLETEHKYIRIFNAAIGDKYFFSTFSENGGKGRCSLFLENDGRYTGQYWDLRKPGSMKNEFLGSQREVFLGDNKELYMAVSGSVIPSVKFYPSKRAGAFKIMINGKFLSADKNTKFPGGESKIFASDSDLEENSDWVFRNSTENLP